MKIIIPLAWIAASSLILGQEVSSNLTIELRTGEKLSVTKISKVEPDGVTVWTDAGVKKITVAKLAKSELDRFSLTEEAAQAHATAVARQESAYATNQQAQAQAQAMSAAPARPATVRFITADQVKVMWVKRLPQPRSLDANYSKIMTTYRKFIGEIQAGKRDLDAQETAATYNKAKALAIGNMEQAGNYEAELGRISEAKIAAAELAQRVKQSRQDEMEFMQLNSQLSSIDLSLRSIKNAVQGW